MASDKEVLDELEKIVDMHMKYLYSEASDSQKDQMSNFFMGMFAGTIVQRDKNNG